MRAVSYTHLDVYKRQVYGTGEDRLVGRIFEAKETKKGEHLEECGQNALE